MAPLIAEGSRQFASLFILFPLLLTPAEVADPSGIATARGEQGIDVILGG